MGYTVRYLPTTSKKASQKRKHLTIPVGLAIILLLSMFINHTWPDETERLRQALFPWHQQSFQEAFTGLQNDLNEGVTVVDAITTFCLDIIEESQLSQQIAN